MRTIFTTSRHGFNLVSILLRLEGGLVLALAVVAYVQIGASWWLFALLILAPDLSALGYLAGPRVGARAYNLGHTYLMPAALGAVGFYAVPALLPVTIIWVAHIGADRLFGYGLKFPTGPRDHHLARLEGRPTGDRPGRIG